MDAGPLAGDSRQQGRRAASALPRRARTGAGPSTINSKALVHLLEQLGRLADAFGGTDDECALRPQRKVEGLQHSPLGDFVEIDQQIAAADEIQA